MPTNYPKERIERAARIYSTAKDAATALGIDPNSFRRLCKKYEVEIPNTYSRLRNRKESA